MDEWNYDMEKCPCDTRVKLLSGNNCLLLPQMEFEGEVTMRDGFRYLGKLYVGDGDYFYRSDMVAWKPI